MKISMLSTKFMQQFSSISSSKKTEQGFTMLEIIIVVFVFALLSAIAAPSWLALVNRSRLNSVQSQVLQAMRQAQTQAKHQKGTWQASFRQNADGLVEWAVHPTRNTNPTWETINEPSIQIETDDPDNTTLATITPNGGWKITFDDKGTVSDQTGRITFSLRNTGSDKRCVSVITVLGAVVTQADGECDAPLQQP